MIQKSILFFVFIVTLACDSLHAQGNDSVDAKEVDYTDSSFTNVHPPKTKHFWRASGELFLCELIPWSFNYFVRDADFSHISFQSIGHNLKPSSW